MAKPHFGVVLYGSGYLPAAPSCQTPKEGIYTHKFCQVGEKRKTKILEVIQEANITPEYQYSGGDVANTNLIPKS